jgi:hypothetical protein
MDIIGLFFPLVVWGLIFFVFAYGVCKRKGRSLIYAWICFIPLFQIAVLIWLASLTDKSVLDRLSALEQRILLS